MMLQAKIVDGQKNPTRIDFRDAVLLCAKRDFPELVCLIQGGR
jgi:hypothetical protein